MTCWTTLFYAGQVVLTLGFEGETGQINCHALADEIRADIANVYADPDVKDELKYSMFPDQSLFKVDTLPSRPEIADQYKRK